MKKYGIVKVKQEWCKGCEICVAYCPKKVLAMDRFKAYVRKPEECIGCLQCETLCPDFCIEVEVIENQGDNQ